eukprot:13273814-Alexandrium_andersonii.AAC.1
MCLLSALGLLTSPGADDLRTAIPRCLTFVTCCGRRPPTLARRCQAAAAVRRRAAHLLATTFQSRPKVWQQKDSGTSC